MNGRGGFQGLPSEYASVTGLLWSASLCVPACVWLARLF